jgi:general L-amino acid transport system permease protein
VTAPARPAAPGWPEVARRWIRRNLARNGLDAGVSAVTLVAVGYVLYRAARFVLVTGRWEVVRVNLKLLLVGRYPVDELERVSVSIVVLTFLAATIAGMVHRRQVVAGTATLPDAPPAARIRAVIVRLWPVLAGMTILLALCASPGPWVTAAALVAAAVVGRVVGAWLPRAAHPVAIAVALAAPVALVAYLADAAPWDEWGGLMLNVLIAVVAIGLCFPLGVLAALGRRSDLPAISWLSTAYIEVLRGAPLFVLLLMANVALQFFIPADVAPGTVVRAIVVFTLFTGAYMAEIVRGGLQSLPPGQEEAAKALGLSPLSTTFRVVLPQALRNVIPAQVGQLISLFKDTTLAGAAMGLFDLAQISSAITSQAEFRGQRLLPETVAFAALLFWIGSYTMSRESQRVEAKLGVGER